MSAQPYRVWAALTAALTMAGAAQAQYPPELPFNSGYGNWNPAYAPNWNYPNYPPFSNPSGLQNAYPYTSPSVTYIPTAPLNQVPPPGFQGPAGFEPYGAYGDLSAYYRMLRSRPPEPTLPRTPTRPGSHVTPVLAAALAGPLAGTGSGGGPLPALTLSATASAVPASHLRSPAALRPSPATVTAGPATVDVTLPVADAEVWVEGRPTHLTGTFRHFLTPPLSAGGQYEYEIRARWRQDGETVSRSRTVRFRAGGNVSVDFTSP